MLICWLLSTQIGYSYFLDFLHGVYSYIDIFKLLVTSRVLNRIIYTTKRKKRKNVLGYNGCFKIEKFTPNFSMKNILFPSKSQSILSLTDKIVDFIKRIDGKYSSSTTQEWKIRKKNFKFKSLKIPPSNKM